MLKLMRWVSAMTPGTRSPSCSRTLLQLLFQCRRMGGAEEELHSFLPSALDGVFTAGREISASRRGHFISEEPPVPTLE